MAVKIHTVLSRITVIAVYAVFFIVQLTAYFDHTTGHTYRVGAEIFHAGNAVKNIPDGLSESSSSAEKLAIRLNKKFHAQSAILYAVFAPKAPVTEFINQPFLSYFDRINTAALLKGHSLRGPPSLQVVC